ALRALPALLGVSSTCLAALTVAPVASAPAAVTPPPIGLPPGTASLPGVSATPVGESVAQLIDQAPLPVPLARVTLRIRKVKLDVLDGSDATVSGALRPRLASR